MSSRDAHEEFYDIISRLIHMISCMRDPKTKAPLELFECELDCERYSGTTETWHVQLECTARHRICDN